MEGAAAELEAKKDEGGGKACTRLPGSDKAKKLGCLASVSVVHEIRRIRSPWG